MTMTIREALKIATKNSAKPVRQQIEQAIAAAAAADGAVYYHEVGATGAWNVCGDCYDWADKHLDQQITF